MVTLNSAYQADSIAFVARARPVKPARSVFSGMTRLLDKLDQVVERSVRSRRESQVATFLAQNGGHLTDELEREMSRRFGGIVGD